MAALLLELVEQNHQLREQNQSLEQQNQEQAAQIAALATRVALLEEQKDRSSRNSSKPPSSDGPGFKPPERRKGSDRKRGGQPGKKGRRICLHRDALW